MRRYGARARSVKQVSECLFSGYPPHARGGPSGRQDLLDPRAGEKTFRATGSLQEAFAVHRELCETYRRDFSRYGPRSDPRRLDEVFQAVAQHVGRQVHYTRLAADFTGPTAKAAFELLCKARVIRKVPSCDPAGLPLGAGAHARRFKAMLVDVGLWQHLSGMKVAADWSREARGSTAEVDYLAVVDGAVHGIEVKSGAAGSLRSLHLLLASFPNVAGGRVFQSGPCADLPAQKLRFLPLYYAFAGTARSAASATL